MKKKLRILIIKNLDGVFYFRIVAKNGRTLAHSEIYSTKQSAIKAANIVKEGNWVIEEED